MIHPVFVLACGSIGDCCVFILSTFLAFLYLSLMNNYHVVLYVFQNFEQISALLTHEVILVVVMFFLHQLDRFWTEDSNILSSNMYP